MKNFLTPPPHKEQLPDDQIDVAYKRLRWQVFADIDKINALKKRFELPSTFADLHIELYISRIVY